MRLKLNGTSTKVILKQALRDILPPEIMNRGKLGFGAPFGYWFQTGAWRELLLDCLSNDTVRRRGIFDPAAVLGWRDRLLDSGDSVTAYHSLPEVWHRVWLLVVLELWARQFLDRAH